MMESLTGPIDKTRLKNDLVLIAQALGLQPKGNKDVLIGRITDHLKTHPDLVLDPRFQGLFTYRPDKAVISYGRVETKAQGKTSADKAKEDMVAGKEADGRASG